jgi:hypothetical protein
MPGVNRNRIAAFLFFASSLSLSIVAFGCSSSSSSGSTGGDSGSDSKDDPNNCVAPGTPGNELGIGGYCSPLGGQCDKAGPGGAPRICTADITSTPAHAWFCTYPCSHDTDCGSGNVCATTAKGSGCVPSACGYLDDGGVLDSGTGGDTSSSEASSEVGDASSGG